MVMFQDYLRVAVRPGKKLIKINKTTIIKSIGLSKNDVELTKMLAQYLGFVYELLTPPDGEMGRLLPNGTWTGMVKMVLQGEADLIVSILSLSEERTKVLDYSYPYYKASITFATRKAEYESDFAVFLRPFSLEIWIYTLITYIFITTIFYKKFKKTHSLQELLLASLGTILRQNICLQPQKINDFILIITWNFGAMFISYCYSAVLLSYLTIPPLSGVRTIPELATAVAKGNYECATYPGTFISAALATSSDPYSRIIGQNMLQNKGSHDVDRVLRNVKSSKKPTFVGGKQHFMGLSTKYFVSEDEFFPALQTIWMRKGFHSKRHLDRFVSYLWSSGIYDQMIDVHSFLASLNILLHPGDEAARQNERCLNVDDFKGAFALLVVGYVFSLLALIIETIVYKFSTRII